MKMAEELKPLVCPVCLQDLKENSCPQCEQNPPGPDESVASVAEGLEGIGLNVDVAENIQDEIGVVECDSFTGLHPDTAEDVQDEIGVVECDSCTGRKEKAIKTCLVCLASYCETHLRMHNELSPGKAHAVVDAGGVLQQKMCSEHHKLLEVYCRTDQQSVCCLCMLDAKHRGHDMVSLATERAEKQRQVENSKRMITHRDAERKEIQKAAGNLRNLAQATEEEVDRIFTELISFIQRSHTETMTLVQTQLSTELDRIHGHLEGLEQEILETRRKQSELEQISPTDDHLRFLQEFQSRWSTSDFPSLTTNPQFSFGEMIKSLSSLSTQIEDIWRLEMTRILSAATAERILLPLQPKTREDFLQFLVPLSLDPSTAHRNLWLTEQNRAVVCRIEPQSCPDHPGRFDWWAQVLSREGLSGRCYWEAEWMGQYGVDVAVSYRDIGRAGQGDDSGFGYNTHSWSLDCSMFRYALVHNNEETEIRAPLSHRIGVYLDYRAGLLSFYSISDTMVLLHNVQTQFTQPLYPGFGLFQGSSARFGEAQEGSPRSKNNKTSTNQRNRKKAVRRSKYLRCGCRNSSSSEVSSPDIPDIF